MDAGWSLNALAEPNVINAVTSPGGGIGLEHRRLREIVHIATGAFSPVLAKHTKSFNLIDTFLVGVGVRMK